MNNIEKILKLLEKNILSAEERIELNSLIESDTGAKKFYETYKTLDVNLKSKHIPFEELGDYILYKNNIEAPDKSFIEKVPQIENHLKNCERCSKEFRTLNSEYAELDSFITDKAYASGPGLEEKNLQVHKHSRWGSRLYTLASIVIVGFVYLALLIVSNITTPAYFDLASIEDKSEFYITRGRSTNEFQQSLEALENNNFDKAIIDLQKDINKNSEEKTIFYSHYILGLSYLEKADKSFLGLFESFNKDNAKNGLENLQLCIKKNASGKFPDITYNAYFYSAKAGIMLGDFKTAKKYLEIVIDKKGSKMFEAQNILNELE